MSYKERVCVERNDLIEKLSKLKKFMGEDKFFNLSAEDRGLLLIQRSAMETYKNVLFIRTDKF